MSVPSLSDLPSPPPPAAPRLPAKLPWWSYVKESYASLPKEAPAFFKSGILCIIAYVVLLLLIIPITSDMAQLAEAMKDTPKDKPSFEGLSALKSLGPKIGFIILGCSLVILPLRAALYRQLMSGAKSGLVIPLPLRKDEWMLVWYVIKMWWFTLWPIIATGLLGGAVGALTAGLKGIMGTAGALVGGLLLFAAIVFGVLWVMRRGYALLCANPGIFDTKTPRMWKDVWPRTKGHRWAIMFGSIVMLLPIVLVNVVTGILPQPVSTVVTMLVTFAFMIPVTAYEVKCYRFLKRNPPVAVKPKK